MKICKADIDFIVEAIDMYKETMFELIDEVNKRPCKFQKDFDDLERYKEAVEIGNDIIARIKNADFLTISKLSSLSSSSGPSKTR